VSNSLLSKGLKCLLGDNPLLPLFIIQFLQSQVVTTMAAHLEEINLSEVESNQLVNLESIRLQKMSAALPNIHELTLEAAKATQNEHRMTLLQGLRTYPKAVGWSVLLSTALVMEGFDLILLNNLFAYDAFNKQFGTLQDNGTYQVSAAWQSGLSNGALVGESESG
jgi:hypothetical protein